MWNILFYISPTFTALEAWDGFHTEEQAIDAALTNNFFTDEGGATLYIPDELKKVSVIKVYKRE